MPCANCLSRRLFLQRLGLGRLRRSPGRRRRARGTATDAVLLSANSPEAKAVQYTEDAKSAKAPRPATPAPTAPSTREANGSTQGPCQIFPGKQVKAAGWCSSWAAQM